MLAIKLQRIGKKHQPSYRLVVAEKRSKMAAPPVEDLGSYSAMTKQSHFNADRVKYWLGVGAQPTTTVQNLLVREKLTNAPKVKRVFKVPASATAAAGGPEKPAVPAEAPAAAPAATAAAAPKEK